MQQTNKMGTAVVTGASAGLGATFADRLAKRGHDLILIARRGDRLEALAKQLREKYAVTVTNLIADLAATDGLEHVAATLAGDSSITMLVNNAGTSTMGTASDTPIQKQTALIDLNITALTALTHAVLPGFKQRDRGTIMNIGSVMALESFAVTAVYSGTKAYVAIYTRGLQQELAGTNVVAHLVAPASVATEIWDVSGYPLASIDPAIVMTIDNCVDAALAGLALGEHITYPSVGDYELANEFETAKAKLFAASQLTGKPAARYQIS